MIEFGRNVNQVSHTFRHIDAEGLGHEEVRQAIAAQLIEVEASLPEGPYTGDLHVKGVSLEFRAYRFDNGDIHFGRITVR